MININNLTKSFDNRKILDISSLNFKSGKISAIVGENGLGKTTLFKIISGLDNEYKGDINIDAMSTDITFLQHPPLMLNRSVFENIIYPLKLRKWGKDKIEERGNELLELFKIGYLKDEKAPKLSSGEKQKVALARAISFYPKVLLLDEPASNLDISSTNLIENFIKKFSKSYNTTTLIISHDKDQVERIADYIVDLKEVMNR